MTLRKRSTLSVTNDTLAGHIQRHGFTAKASTPDQCRWCGRPFNIAGFCPGGCAKEAVNSGDCQECGQAFVTGRARPILCDDCDRRDMAVHVDGYKGSGYRQDRGLLLRDEISATRGEVVGPDLAGQHCYACDRPVELGQRVHVSRDSTGDDGSQYAVRVIHAVCPPEEAA